MLYCVYKGRIIKENYCNDQVVLHSNLSVKWASVLEVVFEGIRDSPDAVGCGSTNIPPGPLFHQWLSKLRKPFRQESVCLADFNVVIQRASGQFSLSHPPSKVVWRVESSIFKLV